MDIIDTFNSQNPWRERSDFAVTPYIHRSVVDSLLKWMDEPEILVLVGPRQSGKTTILFKLIEIKLKEGIVPQKLFFFNCDNVEVRSFLENVTNFMQFLKAMNPYGDSFVFIDEVQRLSNPGLILKQIYDLNQSVKLIVSGSSSLEIRSQIKESLTGRKMVFSVLPFSFTEYLQINELFSHLLTTPAKEIIKNISSFESVWGKKLQSELYHYLTFGGYPRVVLTSDNDKKKDRLFEIYNSYIQKDVSDFMKIENINGFNKLVQLLALTSGQIISKNDLSLKSGLFVETVDKYMQILIDTFIITKVVPFFANKIKEIVKNPKVYFSDYGLHNAVISNFISLDVRKDLGFLQESLIFNELKSFIPRGNSVKFWRRKSGAEMDFVLDYGTKLIPLECKSALKKPIIGKSYYSFIQNYSPVKGFILNHNLFEKLKVNETEIFFIPYHWFPLIKNELLK